MQKVLKIQMDADLKNLGLMRGITAAYASELDPTVEELTEIKTAVSEAFSNAVLHGYAGQINGKVEVEMACLAEDTLMIKVTDHGAGIEDIARAMEPLFTTDTGEDRSGMGFTVMESFMDKIKVDSRLGEGTTVTLIKKIDTYYGI